MKNTPGKNQAGAGSPPQNQIDRLVDLYRRGRFQEVAAHGEALAEQHPSAVVILNILGAANAVMGHWEDAARYLGDAVHYSPGHDEHYNLGVALQYLGRRDEAIEQYTKALQLNPDLALANSNLGLIFNELGRRDEAAERCKRALQIEPNSAEIHLNLGVILTALDRREEAIECCEKALRINPDLKSASLLKLSLLASNCDWPTLAAESGAIAALGVTGQPVRPFKMLTLEDHPSRHLKRAERYTAATFRQLPLRPLSRPTTKPDRLKIGYFSASFHNSAAMHLLKRVFELQNRDQFILHAYSFGPTKNDEMRARLIDAFDAFHDVSQMSDKEMAEFARKDGIDIAVDLMGYTNNSRTGVFAYRSAPVQINFLGYPGSMGAPFIDYIIADRTVIPEDQKEHFSEKIIYFPHTYWPYDNSLTVSDKPIARSAFGLPETGFVFCCFNSSYKITPDEFDIWMRLLKQVDGSVLWLLRTSPLAEANLRREAQQRHVDSDRLVFAEKLPLPEHLARHRLADLFLDTFVVNAHTTASDALWAGLPLITQPGQGFATRVASSLLTAMSLPELITRSREEYENLALHLAQNPEKLNDIKAKLLANRETTPLFDTELFTKNIERAYGRVYQRYFDGLAPDTIFVESADTRTAADVR